jgi:predicted N-acetyltransferase YhbS
MDVTIRHELPDDYHSITQLNDLVFGGKNEGELIINLRKTESFINELSIIAIHNDSIAGQILFYPVTIKSNGKMISTLALAPMAALPDCQRKGIGSKLVEYGLQKSRELGFESVIVLGHSEYYPRFGFKPANSWNIYSDFDVPDEVFMAMELREGALADSAGKVLYPKEYMED